MAHIERGHTDRHVPRLGHKARLIGYELTKNPTRPASGRHDLFPVSRLREYNQRCGQRESGYHLKSLSGSATQIEQSRTDYPRGSSPGRRYKGRDHQDSE
ncbi:MAG: hypothetical protein DDT35_00590 [Firmicutes bacterium]|nr:hypothetical protein [Bacillota bacterium]